MTALFFRCRIFRPISSASCFLKETVLLADGHVWEIPSEVRMAMEILESFQIPIVVLAVGYYVFRTWHLIPLKIERGVNSDDFTEAMFIGLVQEAHGMMSVCDDGNAMPGSIYESPRVVEAVRAKLKRDPTFRMRCLFSSDDETAFRKAFEGEDRVKIRTDRRREVHVKIINGGRKGYVSVHREGERERRYTLYSGVFGRARQEIFGSYMADLDRVFAHAA